MYLFQFVLITGRRIRLIRVYDVGVATKSWAFKAELKVDEAVKKGMKNAELEFEGLDTFAEVSVVCAYFECNADKKNGKEILRAENHFLTHIVGS